MGQEEWYLSEQFTTKLQETFSVLKTHISHKQETLGENQEHRRTYNSNTCQQLIKSTNGINEDRQSYFFSNTCHIEVTKDTCRAFILSHGKPESITTPGEYPGILGKGSFGKVKLAFGIDKNIYVVKKINLPYDIDRQYASFEINLLKKLGIFISYFFKPSKKHYDKRSVHIIMHYFPGIQLKYAQFSDLRSELISAISLAKQLKKLFDIGYIHTDIKGDNILYDPKTNTITLIDYGNSVSKNSIFGGWLINEIYKKDFIAPELKIPEPNNPGYCWKVAASEHQDIFSLGKIFEKYFYRIKTTPGFCRLLSSMINPDIAQRPNIDTVIKTLQNNYNIIYARPPVPIHNRRVRTASNVAPICNVWPQVNQPIVKSLPPTEARCFAQQIPDAVVLPYKAPLTEPPPTSYVDAALRQYHRQQPLRFYEQGTIHTVGSILSSIDEIQTLNSKSLWSK